MSTKIYDAYRIKEDIKNFDEVHTFILKIRDNIFNILKEDYNNRYIKECVTLYDFAILGKLELLGFEGIDDKSFFGNTYDVFSKEERNIKVKKERNPCYDFFCDFVLFYNDNRFYLKFYCESKRVVEYINSLKEIEDYSYWNNSDAPDNVSEEEWDEREKTWDKIFEKCIYEIPCTGGYTIEVVPHYYVLEEIRFHEEAEENINKILDSISFEERVNRMVTVVSESNIYALCLDYIKDKYQYISEENKDSFYFYFDLKSFVSKKIDKNILDENKKEISNILDRKIEIDFLRRKIKDVRKEISFTKNEKYSSAFISQIVDEYLKNKKYI